MLQSGTPLEGFTVMELDVNNDYNNHKTGFENGTLYLNFEDASSIAAGKPYIVKKIADNVEDPVFYHVTINSADPTPVTSNDRVVSFIGSYSPVYLNKDDKTVLFLGVEEDGSYLYYPDENMTIGSCRAYFQLNNGITAGDPATSINNIVLNFGTEGTGIREMKDEILKKGNESGAWFTLDGLKHTGQPTKKGIYINNGRKVVIQ